MQTQRYRVIGPFQDRSRNELVTPETHRIWPPADQEVSQERLEALVEAECLAPAGMVAAKEAATAAKLARDFAVEAEAKAEVARKTAQDAHDAADAAAELAEQAEQVAAEAAELAELAASEEGEERQPLSALSVEKITALIEDETDGDLLLLMHTEETKGKARKGALEALEARLEALSGGATGQE